MPFRRALSYALSDLILTYGVPAINATFTAELPSVDAASVQLTAKDVPLGDLPAVSQPQICIVAGPSRNEEMASGGQYLLTLQTEIRVKTPWVLDSSPEAFDYFFGVVTDTMRDLLNNDKTRSIVPKNAVTGGYALPPKLDGGPWGFTECKTIGESPMGWPQTSAEGVVRYRGILITHKAEIQYSLRRSAYVGP